ncbi:MAG: hypothetical protein RBG13Loki_3778 [Promethearchaeota archaeon CR_4]|nr:MAG: hypothetical protein RBG13Loki_3778 [Candidatus Lokiarchaeota archaeon CR_4]
MAEFDNLVKRIARILDEIHLKYVIVGGFATILRGRPRTTTDLDLIIENNQEKIETFLEELKKQNFDMMENQFRMAIKEGTNISIFDNLSPLRVDLKVATKRDDITALTSAIKESYNGVIVQVASTEQILYGKVLYLGDISDIPDTELIEYQDVRDFINVFRQQRDQINLNVLKENAQKAGLTHTLEKLIAEAKKKSTKQQTLF